MDSRLPVSDGLTIGQVADRARVGVETVRFYERKGLLAAPPRRESGYRSYPPDSILQLLFIRRARALGFSLAEIRRLLDLRSQGKAGCGAVRSAILAKLQETKQRLRALQDRHLALEAWAENCDDAVRTSSCPLLAALGTAEAGAGSVRKSRSRKTGGTSHAQGLRRNE